MLYFGDGTRAESPRFLTRALQFIIFQPKRAVLPLSGYQDVRTKHLHPNRQARLAKSAPPEFFSDRSKFVQD